MDTAAHASLIPTYCSVAETGKFLQYRTENRKSSQEAGKGGTEVNFLL